MTLEKALQEVKEQYERAKKMEYVQKPLAWALYQVWKMAEREAWKKGEV